MDNLRTALLALVISLCQFPFASTARAQLRDMRELNTVQLQSLDLQRTVILIPGGILEQHGPYLPSYTDGYVNEFVTQEIAEAVVARSGWSVLMFPPIPLGAGGANQVGFKHVFPGTYHVHFESLRSIYMDIAAELGEAGFEWIFVVSSHGAASHHRALNQASDFFNDTYAGTMVHLTGVIPPNPQRVDLGLSNEERDENGFDVHGGMDETSRILFIRPDLVSPGFVQAAAHAGRGWSDLVEIGRRDGWPGYFGSPRLATAARGAMLMKARSKELTDLALAILDGLDPRQLQSRLDVGAFAASDPGRARYEAESKHHEAEIEGKKRAWLERKGY